MKKTGILTFHFANNYGALLQAYGLLEFLKKHHAAPEIINYSQNGSSALYSLNPFICAAKCGVRYALHIPERIVQSHKFDSFRKEQLGIRDKIPEISDEYLSNYDRIIVGSDQVWNGNIVDELDDYLLKGYLSGQKYSYAASTGYVNIEQAFLEKIKNELPKFSKISLREKASVREITEKCHVRAEHVCDPVFLLGKEEWRHLYRKSSVDRKEQNYILFIDLYDSKELMEKAAALSSQTNLKIVTIHPTARNRWNGCTNLRDVGPIDYLYLIDNAEYVVTNSFHGMAFAYIFEKKTLYFLKDKLSVRIEDLLITIGINQDKEIIDFNSINKDESKMTKLIMDSKSYLISLFDGAYYEDCGLEKTL